MKNSKKKLVLSVIAIAIGVIPLLDGGLWTDAAASGPDRDPPVVLVQPTKPLKTGAPVIIGAQIVDPSGIGRVVLWIRGEGEDEFRQYPMEQIGEDRVEVRIPAWAEQGSYVAYYIEARDGKGNGPGYAGAPRTPYVIRVKGAAAAPAEARAGWGLWAVTIGVAAVLVGGYFLHRRATRQRLYAELNEELNRLAGVTTESGRATKAQAKAKAKAKTKTEPKKKKTEPKKKKKPKVHVPQNPAEQAFWIGLLSPVIDMGTFDREHALKNMAVRAHHHPTLGKRFFDVGTLARHLEWVQRGDIQVTADMIDKDPLPAPTGDTKPQ